MVVSLLLAGVALRFGLELRRARLARRSPRRGARRAHLRFARPAVLLVAVGLVAGPASALWLRGWEPLGSLHGWLGLAAGGLFAATAVLGRRLERGDGSARTAHALCAAFAMLLSAVAAIAGFVLLP